MQLKAGDRVTAGRTMILFDPTAAQSAAAKPAGADAGSKPAAAAAAPPASNPAGGWAPAPPVAPPAAAKAAGEGTAPLPNLAGTSSDAAPAWKRGLLVAVVLGGTFIAALVLYLLVFSGG
jgi:pyruvate/2-oxoglutarate dehydrogenase complex dihydrolipoamide acyltransferase (E2) component